MSAIVRRALAALRARPASTIATILGLFFAGAILGSAVTTRDALGGGLDRAQVAAGTADIEARFNPVPLTTVQARLDPIANIAGWSARLTVRPVDIGTRRGDGQRRTGTAEANGILSSTLPPGILMVAGHWLTGGDDEVVIERGLFDSWHLRLGQGIVVRGRRGPLFLRVVGASVEPDTLAFPLASRPRIYLPYLTVRRALSNAPGRRPVTAVNIDVRDPSRLPVTLAQLRAASFGLEKATLQTRTGIRLAIDQAAGLISSVIAAFALVALAAALVMIAAAAHARVTRDLATIGALRAIGFPATAIAGTYALEVGLLAVVAGGAGIVVGSVAVAGSAAELLKSFNSLPPPHTLAVDHLLVAVLAVAGAAVAAGTPALLAARRPVAELLRGAAVVRTSRAGVVGSPLLLGARLAVSRPVRLAASVVAVAGGVAVVLVMSSLARTLQAAQDNPQSLGVRYSVLVQATPGALATVRATPGIAAAATRYDTLAVDAFDLGQPLRVVAFGDGAAGVFDGRPILTGRRAAAPGEAEVGEGLASSLGLSPGQTLIADPQDGGEVRLRVVAVVREPLNDGRIAYTDEATLLAAQPAITPQIAVRPAPGTTPAEATRRLAALGIRAVPTDGLLPSGSSFVAAVVALLRAVAVVNGAGSIALAVLALVGLARERAETVAVVRVVGGGRLHVAMLLAGAAITLIGLAVVLAAVLEVLVLDPIVTGLLGTYGALELSLARGDLLLVAIGGLLAAVAASVAVAIRYSRVTVLAALRAE